MTSQVKHRRITSKASGEVLAGLKDVGIDPIIISHLAKEIKSVHNLGVETGVVCGGGNMWRGEIGTKFGVERSQTDYMGMPTTIMNGLVSQDGLEHVGTPMRAQTSIEMRQAVEPYIRRRAVRHLEKGRVVILGSGTDNPYFSADTTAALRTAKIDADVILTAKNGVDGVYLADPGIGPSVTKYDGLTRLDVISKNSKMMDRTASSLSMNTDTPLIVFNIDTEGSIKRVIEGENIGTIIRGGK